MNAGTYATAASYQAELQADVDARRPPRTPASPASVTVNVRDLGGGAWSLEFVRNSTDSHGNVSTKNLGSTNGAALAGASAATIVNNGGVFQVGANVTNRRPDQPLDQRHADRERHRRCVHLARRHRRDQHEHLRERPDPGRRRPQRGVQRPGSARCGAEPLPVDDREPPGDRQNLSASESQIADTNMSLEMVNFTKDQILLQAGTAMLAQANAVPQTILKLLQ